MKQIIISLMVIAAINCKAQDSEYLKLWNKYVDECSEVVKDTITETGIVTYEISPKDGDLKLVPKDTTWNTIECDEYKENNWYSSGITISSLSNDYYTYANTGTLGVHSVSKPTKSTFETGIKRTKICNCKLRKPNKEDFWEWLKEKGYRK
jgi:hypothetical protein